MSDDPATPPAADDGPPIVRAGFCAIVGVPNVGKSTLLNRVLGVRLAAVSPKPQTTRNRILGIHHVALPDEPAPARAQLAFVDTPGIQDGKGALRRYMRDEALAAAGETDCVLLVVDASDARGRLPRRLGEPDAVALGELVRSRPLVVALNKIDRVAKPELLPLMEAWHAWAAERQAEIVPVSALTGDGLAPLCLALARLLPRGPALFPPDQLTDRDDRFLSGELIREQLYHQLGQELPYAAAVMIERYEERPSQKDVVIGAVVVVERDSQKAIVVGKGGARIKQLGVDARAAVAELLGCPVHLTLHVKVVPEWSQGQRGLSSLGYTTRGSTGTGGAA